MIVSSVFAPVKVIVYDSVQCLCTDQDQSYENVQYLCTRQGQSYEKVCIVFAPIYFYFTRLSLSVDYITVNCR
jgi:hypothetical protein